MDSYTLSYITNTLNILEACNILAVDGANYYPIREMHNICKGILENYGEMQLEWLKEYLHKNTFEQITDILDHAKSFGLELDYGTGSSVYPCVIYISAEFERPYGIITYDDMEQTKPVKHLLEGEVLFEIVLDPNKLIYVNEYHGWFGTNPLKNTIPTGDETMDMIKNLTPKEKQKLIKILFEEEAEDLYQQNYNYKDAMKPDYKWESYEVPNYRLEDAIFNEAPTFAPLDLAGVIGLKWTVDHNFVNCLKEFDKTKVDTIIKDIAGDINTSSYECLDKVLTKDTKTKIIKKLL